MPPNQKTGVFISYARNDGEALASELRSRLAAEDIPLWRDRESMEGGRDWWLQITAALDTVEFMVLVMTPAALTSSLVRKEWRYARQRGVCVYPVKGTPDLDFDALPRWMRSVHFYDLDHEWTKLLNDLRTRCEQRRVPFMAEDLPQEFVRRPAELDQLVSHILDRTREEPIAITAALRAAGGYGKTVLARAICHDEEVQDAFDDGVLWVTLGEDPGDLTGRVEDLIYLLSGQRPGFSGIEAAVALLVELIADRDILMVIDDVWDLAHVKPFLQGGPRCARVITTRVLDAIPQGASRLDLGPMQQEEAVALLGFGMAGDVHRDLRLLAARLCEWPLLLKMANAALRDRVQTGQSIPAALAYVNRAFDKRGFTVFDARDPVARDQAVAKTLELSVERLNERERERFAELAVFPEDVNVPLATLEKLWGRTGGLDDFDTEHLCDRLSRLSLILMFDPTRRYFRVHDVIRRLLIHQLGGRLAMLHQELLDAHRPTSRAWADLPREESYLWDHLVYHLKSAGRADDLMRTVADLRYLAAKTMARTALAAEQDLLIAERDVPGDATMRTLRRSFVQSSHIFNRCDGIADLEATLHSRLQHVGGLVSIAEDLATSLSAPHLIALQPLPDLPHPALIRTMLSSSTVWGCAIAPDSSFIVSAAYDGALTAWDAASAAERLRLEGHTGWVRRCAVSPDGSFIVSASYDRRLRIWDATSGVLRQILAGHTDGVTDCAVSPDGTFIVSASHDATLRIWDARTGEIRHTLTAEWDDRHGWLTQRTRRGHSAAVWACAISADGRLIASASSDETLKIWDAHTGEELRTLSGHTAMVTGCAFSPDGALIVSAGADRTVRLWDSHSGAERHVLTGHQHTVSRCAFTPDGRSVLSVSADQTLKVWNAATGSEQATYYGHTDWVNDCAAAPDGSYFVSASLDGTLRMWDATHEYTTLRPAQHRDLVNRCVVSAHGDLVLSASSDMTLKLWTNSGAGLRTLIGHESAVRDCVFGPNDDYILSASADKTLKVWDPKSGMVLRTMIGHRDWVNGCAVSRDGQLFVSASSDRTLRVWDGRTGVERLRIVAHRDSINACAFSPGGVFFVSASTDNTLKVWRVDTAREVWESLAVEQRKFTEAEWQLWLEPVVLAGHTAGVNDCAVAPDGSFIVSASSDHTLKIWNGLTGAPMVTLIGHRHHVNGCAISPDGTLVASASDDNTVRIWNATTGVCLTTLYVDGGLADCAWCADGQGLVAAGAGGVYFLRLVGATAGQPKHSVGAFS